MLNNVGEAVIARARSRVHASGTNYIPVVLADGCGSLSVVMTSPPALCATSAAVGVVLGVAVVVVGLCVVVGLRVIVVGLCVAVA